MRRPEGPPWAGVCRGEEGLCPVSSPSSCPCRSCRARTREHVVEEGPISSANFAHLTPFGWQMFAFLWVLSRALLPPPDPPNIAPGMWQVLCPFSWYLPLIHPPVLRRISPQPLAVRAPHPMGWASGSPLPCRSVPSQDRHTAPPKHTAPPLCHSLLELHQAQLGCQVVSPS